MPKINVLPKSVAELIAAGEVVERPSSAVKELVENSIDAGATAVTVEIKNGGVSYIRVTDNGCGIHKTDVRTAFISHATSKITSGEDLEAIFTLGFRGEALPSIAAVSRLSMLTKVKEEELGTSIELEGSEETYFDDAGCPDGTTIIVRDLFFNTPARMKFLKKDMTEGSYVTDVVTKIALSHPEVRFSLIKDSKQVLSTPGKGDLKAAVFSIFGKEISEALIPCEYEYKSIRVQGFISRPLNNRPNRNMQFCFVNSRYVRMPVAAAALDEAYKNRIMVGKFPVCFLFISIPAGKIDVNVHPAKTEIRFSEDSAVFEAIFYAAKSALNYGDNIRPEVRLKDKKDVSAKKTAEVTQMSFSVGAQLPCNSDNNSLPQKPSEKDGKITLTKREESVNGKTADNKPQPPFTPKPAVQSSQRNDIGVFRDTSGVFNNLISHEEAENRNKEIAGKPVDIKSTSCGSNPLDIVCDDEVSSEESSQEKNITEQKNTEYKPFTASRDNEKKNNSITDTQATVSPDKTLTAETEKTDNQSVSSGDFRIVGEIFATYILVEEGTKLLIIDKHAAHERMIFDEISKNGFSQDSQLLLSPVFVTLSGKEFAAVSQNLQVFEKGGFAVEEFGDNTVIVRECPVTLTKEDIVSIITEMAGELVKGNMKPVPEKLTWLYHSTACRAAVKAGDRLKDEETQVFVKKLLENEDIRYCPHGRPVMYELTKHEIEKQFGRI